MVDTTRLAPVVHYEYTTRSLPKSASWNAFNEDSLKEEGWERVWADQTIQGAFVVYRREIEPTANTIPPPVTDSDRHLAAYRVRCVQRGEPVAGVDARLSHDYQLVDAVVGALQDSKPMTRVRALLYKWGRDAQRLLESSEGAGPELLAETTFKKLIQTLHKHTVELKNELNEALVGSEE